MADATKARNLPARKVLTEARLNELLNYDPETGWFVHMITARNRRRGERAGTTNQRGYREIKIDRMAYKEHRLAFLYVTGEFPSVEVDHVNRVKSDNRFSNLRLCSRSQNCANKTHRSASPLKGASWRPRENRWIAQICKDGKKIFLGGFATAEAAHAAYAAKAIELFGEFARSA